MSGNTYFLLLAITSAAAFCADLPVRQVVLYKHGVGYFERSGEVAAGESAQLDFKAAEMNDVLKSLTIEEKSGGKIAGLRYDASEALAGRLGGFPFQLGAQEPLGGGRDPRQGARVGLGGGSDRSAQPTLEGGAIVDNTTGEDWTNVQLALVSGRPISFVSLLYEPKYVQRPVAELPEDRAQKPTVYEGAIAGLAEEKAEALPRD